MPRAKVDTTLEDINRAKRKAKINTWKPKANQKYVEKDGRLFVCHFDKIYNQPKLARFNKFFIRKGSYENQLTLITDYINFFINCYDTDDELITAYLKIKFETDERRTFTEANMDAYISFLYELLFTDTMVDKINRLVEDNYLDDIEVGPDKKRKKYQKNGKKHLESLEFTNQHIKILLRISFAMKIMCPAVFHYLAINSIKVEKDSDTIYKFYERLFTIFGKVDKHTDEAYPDPKGKYFYIFNKATGYWDKYSEKTKRLFSTNILKDKFDPTNKNNYPEEKLEKLHEDIANEEKDKKKAEKAKKELEENKIAPEPRDYIAEYNLYNKLFVYVKAKVNESYSNNTPIFDQQEIFGVDIYSVIRSFVKRVLISENIVKYKFNNIWDAKQHKYKENIIGFNKTIIKYQIIYFLKEQYSKNLTEVTSSKNTDGLSGSDKLMMNLSKIDEGITIMADINIPLTIDYLGKLFNVKVSDDEIDYYIKNHAPNKIQIQLVKSYFAKYFGSYRDLSLLTRVQYITLMLYLKKKLTEELGYSEPCEEGEIRPMALPYIISGNCTDFINTRVIRNLKFTEKVKSSYTYEKLKNDNYRYLEYIKPNYIMQIISSLINMKYTYCEYNNQTLFGHEIEYSDDKISDEILFFMESI